MANRIFDTILQRNIGNFVATFVDDSKSIFYDKEQLIHPGEFGKYRENSLKELLKYFTKYKISDGFIITDKNSVSTQCDVIIYDNEDLPILENNNTQFFTIESVIAIGEVKSSLSFTKFKDALIKLAKNAMLFEESQSTIKKKGYGNEHDTPITFLVCKNLTFDISNPRFDEIYKGIDRKYWHHGILILEQCFFHYIFEFKHLRKPYRTDFINKGFDIESKSAFERSFVTLSGNQYECSHAIKEIEEQNKFYHIMMFLAGLSQSIFYKTLYDSHLINYSSLIQAKLKK